MFVLKSTHQKIIKRAIRDLEKLEDRCEDYADLVERAQKEARNARYRADSNGARIAQLEAQLANREARIAQLESQLAKREVLGDLSGGQVQFTPDEIKQLIWLCHPDKHGGKGIAEKMTQKLLKLRK